MQLVFENWPTSNWLCKDWAKEKLFEERKKNFMLIEDHFPNHSSKQKASIMGISLNYYYELKRGYLK